MKFLKHLVSIFLVLALSVVVCAQRKSQSSRIIPTDQKITVILKQLQLSTSKFRGSLNKSLVRSRVDQTTPENDINTLEPGFETAIVQLRNQIGSHAENVANVEDVLQQASLINAFLVRNNLGREVQIDWATVRQDLNGLAQVYGVTWSWNPQSISSFYVNGSTHLSDNELNDLIQRLEDGGDRFRSSLTDAFDHTGFDQTSGEGKMNNALRGLKRETDQLRNQFDAKEPVTGNVATLVVRAIPIDVYMRGNLLTDRVQNDWRTLCEDINTLAAAFKLSEIGRR
jgi:hypothetical protein